MQVERKKPCQSLHLQKEKWGRKVEALDTAIEIYIEKGYLNNDADNYIPAGPKLCTTAYEGFKVDDRKSSNSKSNNRKSFFPKFKSFLKTFIDFK